MNENVVKDNLETEGVCVCVYPTSEDRASSRTDALRDTRRRGMQYVHSAFRLYPVCIIYDISDE